MKISLSHCPGQFPLLISFQRGKPVCLTATIDLSLWKFVSFVLNHTCTHSAVFRGLYRMLGREPKLAACKTSTLPYVLSVLSPRLHPLDFQLSSSLYSFLIQRDYLSLLMNFLVVFLTPGLLIEFYMLEEQVEIVFVVVCLFFTFWKFDLWIYKLNSLELSLCKLFLQIGVIPRVLGSVLGLI